MKTTRKALALLLALTMIFALAACGGGGEAAGAPEEDVARYVPAFKSVDDDIGHFNTVAVAGDAIYVASSGRVTKTYDTAQGEVTTTSMEDETYVPVIYKLSMDGSTYSQLESYAATPIPEGMDGSTDITALEADGEGGLWVAENTYAYPKDGAGNEEDVKQTYALRHVDATGAETAVIDLTDVVGESEYFYLRELVCDSAGNLYFSDGSTTLYAYDKAGQQLFTLTNDNYIFAVISLKDGSPAAACYDASYNTLIRPVDTAKKAWGKTMNGIGANLYNIYSGGGEYDILYTTTSKLMGYKGETEESVEILDWLDCDIDQGTLSGVTMLPDGTVISLENVDDSGEIATLTLQAASEITDKTVLTLATMNLGSNLRSEVLKFNKESENYRISVQDYSEYIDNDAGDISPALTKLNTEMIAGNVPDMLDVGMLSTQEFVSKGLLMDLYEFMDKDTEVTRDSLVPSITKALEVGGKLYQASDSFGVFTIMGRADIVGGDGGWTLDEMMDIYNAQPEGTELFQQGVTQKEILQILCYMYMDSLVDWDAGECHFDTPQFYKILELCSLFDETFDYSQDNLDNAVSRIQEGRQMLQIDTLYDFQTFQMYQAMFGGDISYKGFPTEEGSGNIGYVENGLAITTKCEDPDGAWSFVRRFLTKDYQEDNVWYFPTNQAAFDEKLEEAMEVTYTTDENGNQVEESKGGWSWDELYIDIYAVKQEEADRIMSVIDSVENTVSMDGSITNIVIESSKPYYAGEATAEEVAKIIQSKASLYVNEQK